MSQDSNSSTETRSTGSHDEATAIFASLLTDDLTIAETEGKVEGADEATEKEDEDKDTSQETKPTDESESSEGEEGEDESDSEEEDAEEGDEDEPTFTVKVGGKEVKVPLSELTKGYSRQSDYTKKTQELAAERKAISELKAKHDGESTAVRQERERYGVLLKALDQRLEELMPEEPDWQALYAQDKNEYLLQRDNWRALQEQREAIKAESEAVEQTNRTEHMKARSNHIANEGKRLLEKVPAWKDEKVRAADLAALSDYAKNSLGFSDQEIANASDHRTLLAVHKARLYDALQAKAKDVKPTAKSKTMGAGAASPSATPSKSKAARQLSNRLAQSGSTDDMTALLSTMDL